MRRPKHRHCRAMAEEARRSGILCRCDMKHPEISCEPAEPLLPHISPNGLAGMQHIPSGIAISNTKAVKREKSSASVRQGLDDSTNKVHQVSLVSVFIRYHPTAKPVPTIVKERTTASAINVCRIRRRCNPFYLSSST
jgi:hypothetical protein